MKIAFLHSDKPRERILADAFLQGCRAHGHDTEAIPLGDEDWVGDYDIAVMVGVKSRPRFRAHRYAGRKVIYLDKGYSRHKSAGSRIWEYWRVAIDAHQPTSRLDVNCSPDRMIAAEWHPAKWRKIGAHVIFAGSSEKYHNFYGLTHPTKYARSVVNQLVRTTERRIIYRPKPSWHGASPLKRAGYSVNPQSLADLFDGAWCLVTHGSNACFDAVMAGIPCIILGDAVALPISSTSLDDVNEPRLVDYATRDQWLANLAYWQWTESEMASGEAWQFIGSQIHAA